MLTEADRRFIGVLMFIGSIMVLVVFPEMWGTVAAVLIWIASLLWMAQPRPHREDSHEAYGKQNTPLDDAYSGNLIRRKRVARRLPR
jgi:hypothetical protein